MKISAALRADPVHVLGAAFRTAHHPPLVEDDGESQVFQHLLEHRELLKRDSWTADDLAPLCAHLESRAPERAARLARLTERASAS